MKNFFKNLGESFYSKIFYGKVAHHWKGLGFAFLGGVSVIETIVFVLIMSLIAYPVYKNGVEQYVPQVIEQMPEITLENGKASINKPTPHYVTLAAEPRMVMAADTKAATMDADALFNWMKQNGVVVYLSQTKLIFMKDQRSEMRIIDLSEFKERMVITQADWREWIGIATSWIFLLPILAVICVFPFMWLGHIICALLLSIVGFILRFFIRGPLTYSDLVRLASVSMAPYILIMLVPKSFAIDFGVWSWLLMLGYYIFALRSSRSALAH